MKDKLKQAIAFVGGSLEFTEEEFPGNPPFCIKRNQLLFSDPNIQIVVGLGRCTQNPSEWHVFSLGIQGSVIASLEGRKLEDPKAPFEIFTISEDIDQQKLIDFVKALKYEVSLKAAFALTVLVEAGAAVVGAEYK